MKIAVLTDTTAYMTEEEVKQNNIYLLPLSVIFDQEVFRETLDISASEFYEKMKGTDIFPTSSQPSVGEAYELLDQLAKEYDAVIAITLSSGISGTYQTLVTLAEEFKEKLEIYPVDSGASCGVQARGVRLACRLIKEGTLSPLEISQRCERLFEDSDEYFIVDDLNQLQRGGRLSAGAAVVGSLLKIKPILTFEDKKIVVFEKIRTQSKSMKRVEEILDDVMGAVQGTGYDIIVIHANVPEKGQDWVTKLQKQFPGATCSLSYFGPVIGTHLGEGAIGVTFAKSIDSY